MQKQDISRARTPEDVIRRYELEEIPILVKSTKEITLEVATKVGENEVISKINLSPEAVTIQAGKIDIAGTITAINGDTTTTIDGGKITSNSITATQIAANTITASEIAANTITASQVASDIITTTNFSSQNIDASKITTGTLSADRIGANSITSGKLNVGTLSAISGDLGTITGGSININNYFSVNSSGGTQLSSSGGGFLSTRVSTHPYVSAVNVASIAGGGISFRDGTSQSDAGNQVGRIFKGTGDYIYVEKGSDSGYIRSTTGDYSSRILKENFEEFKESDYKEALDLLKDINIQFYNYKYRMYDIDKNFKYYGFIIDDIEKLKNNEKFFKFKDERAKIVEGGLNHDIGTEENEELIDYKSFDETTLIKYLMVCIKGLQKEIEDLKEGKNDSCR